MLTTIYIIIITSTHGTQQRWWLWPQWPGGDVVCLQFSWPITFYIPRQPYKHFAEDTAIHIVARWSHWSLSSHNMGGSVSLPLHTTVITRVALELTARHAGKCCVTVKIMVDSCWWFAGLLKSHFIMSEYFLNEGEPKEKQGKKKLQKIMIKVEIK